MQRKTLYATDGETIEVANQWAAEAEKRGTSVSASAWETTAGALSGETLTGDKATVLLAVNGCGEITNTATLANGEVLVAKRLITADSA